MSSKADEILGSTAQTRLGKDGLIPHSFDLIGIGQAQIAETVTAFHHPRLPVLKASPDALHGILGLQRNEEDPRPLI